MSRTVARNGTELTQRFDEVELQVPAVQEQWRYSYARCRVCFSETEGSSQCHGSRYSCSGWSDLPVPSWTAPFRDLTDGRGGGCTYQWRVECRHNRESIFNSTTEPNPSFSPPNQTQPNETQPIDIRTITIQPNSTHLWTNVVTRRHRKCFQQNTDKKRQTCYDNANCNVRLISNHGSARTLS